MAITATDMAVNIADTSNISSYTSAAFTPVANRLYLLAVCHSDAAPEATHPTITTTTGLNFVEVASVVFDTTASNLHRLTLFRALKSSGLSNGTYTINETDNGTGAASYLIEFDGIDTTGTDGANAVRQPTTNNADATANPNVTLGAFADANNGVFCAVGADANNAMTAGGGFTKIPAAVVSYTTPGTFLHGQWRADNDTSVDSTMVACDWAAIAVELVAAAVGGATITYPELERRTRGVLRGVA